MKTQASGSQIALAASWLVMMVQFCAYAFAAIGWHQFQLGTLVLACIAWDILDKKPSKRWLLAGGLVGLLGGFFCHLFFFVGPGISVQGLALLVPVSIFFVGVGLRIYYLERTQESPHAA